MSQGPLKVIPIFMAPRVIVGLDTPEEVEAFRKGWCHATREIHKAVFRRGIQLDLKPSPLSDIEETRIYRLADKGRKG